jgi:hypothetical protein
MIGIQALIAFTAFFFNTISPVQASENKEVSFNLELPAKNRWNGDTQWNNYWLW